MKRNFGVNSEISLFLDGSNFDLHSEYKLKSMCWNAGESSLGFNWVAQAEGKRQWLKLVFDGILLLDIIGIDMDVPRKEDVALDFLGFLHPEDRNVMSGFLPEKMATPEHHFILKFLGGLTVKVFAREAVLSCGET